MSDSICTLPQTSEQPQSRIRIGISACLLGQKVRFDGGAKSNRFVLDTLAPHVQFVPCCPEVEMGLGTPREAIRLVERGDGLHLEGSRSGQDHTAAMQAFARRKVEVLGQMDLCGFILKKDSPSCGMERVKVYSEQGPAARRGRGLFADALLQAYPLLPVEEEGRLNDAVLRENFLERVFAYRRLRDLFEGDFTRGDVVSFHTAEKLLLRSHGESAYRELGKLVAGIKTYAAADFARLYQRRFMEALSQRAKPQWHYNVLQHVYGYFKGHLTPPQKAELMSLFADFKRRILPLVVPLTLIRHYIQRYDIAYLKQQTYFQPHPKELMLHNYVPA